MTHINSHLPDTGLDPFYPGLNPDIFFPGAKREEICQALILDLLTGKQLLHLSGDSGSGKSLICQVIMERLPSSFTPVYLADPVGSYEDLVRHTCIDLGAAHGNRADDFSWSEEFNRQLLQRQGENGRVVLILDQAERIFSATLERLLQRNRQLHPDAPGFAMLLAGSGALSNLLNQLAALDAGNIPESSYVLPPLEREETEKYLRYRLHAAGIDWIDHDRILDRKTVARIIKQARGNIARINTAATRLLATRLPAPGPAAADPPPQALPKASIPSAPQKIIPSTAPEPADGDDIPPTTRWEQLLAPPLIELYELLVGNRKILGAILGGALLLSTLGLLLEQWHQPGSIAQEQKIQAGSHLERSPDDTEAMQTATQDIRRHAHPAEKTMAGPPGQQVTGASLLQERLTASTALVAAAYRGASTIQLLTISGTDAEDQISSLLDSPHFIREAQQLYIFRKRSNPPTYFIFYGIFDNLEQARQVRNNMSFELRVHHPYPLAITDALLLNEG